MKHYRIRQLDEGGFFIARRVTFRTLSELVDHYSHDADGLCVNLRKPCSQVGWRLTYRSHRATFMKHTWCVKLHDYLTAGVCIKSYVSLWKICHVIYLLRQLS